MPHKRRPGRIALGLGLVTGAIAGLLFAPEEGKKIRTKISKGDHKGLLEDLKHMGEEIGDMITDLTKQPHVVDAIDKAKDRAAEVAQMKREELDKMLKDANKKADSFKKTVESYVKDQKAALDEMLGDKPKKKSTKKKSTAKKTTSTKKTAPKKKSTAKKSTATKKAAPKKSTAKKSTAKKTTAKKSTKKKS